MTDVSSPVLSQLLVSLKRDKRLTWTHIAEHAGIARNTLDSIRNGQTKRPDISTLRGLARSYATEPDPPCDVDDQESERLFGELYLAAGYPKVHLPPGADLLRAGLFLVSGSRAKASALDPIVRHLARLPLDQIRQFGRGVQKDEN